MRRTRGLAQAAAVGVMVVGTCAALWPAAAQAAPTWSAATAVDTSGRPLALSCSSASFCATVDANGNASTFNGSTWSKTTDIDGTTRLVSVSCPSSSFCAAVDVKGNELTFNGSSWGKPVVIDAAATLTSVSCPLSPSSFCVVVDDQGDAVTHSGSTWSKPVSIDPSGFGMTSVSCASTTFCVAGDQIGHVLTFNGTSWSTPTPIGDPGAFVASVSCFSATFCVAMDSVSGAATYDGSSWSKAVKLDSALTNSQSSVSCPTATFCVVIDFNGNAYTYSAPSGVLKNTVAPSLSGGAVQGVRLSATHGSWSGSPTAYKYAWEDCNSGGSACTAIAGATQSSYVLRPGDVGHTVRVLVMARTSGGDVGQAASAHTPLVASIAQIEKLVGVATVPPRAAASIRALLGAGFYRVKLEAPTAGKLVIHWYHLPPGAHLPAAAQAPAPELVAAGKVTYPHKGARIVTIALTATGRRLLVAAKRLTVTANAAFTPLRGHPLAASTIVTLRP
jgi:hypothetical protein